MNLWRRLSIVLSAAICVVFSLAFAIMLVAAKFDRNPFDQLVLVAVGSALLGAGLVVVLVQVFTTLATAQRGDQY
jgi:prolipoprotein diacylglyceryltransferase